MSGTVSASPRAPRYRNAKGQFCKACDAVPAVVAAPAPVVVPVIDDVPAVSAPVVEAPAFTITPEQDAWLRREERLAAADARARAAARRGSAVLFMAAGFAVLAFVAGVLFSGPQASAHVERAPAAHGAGHAAFRFAEARTMHLATCDRLAGKGDDGWYVEAARLTAESGSRYTARSLAVSCALASVVRPVVRR